MDGDDGVVDVHGARQERLDLHIRHEGLHGLHGGGEVLGHVFALGVQFEEGIQVADPAVEARDGLLANLQGPLFLEEGGRALGVVPEVGGRRGGAALLQACIQAGFVKDSPLIRWPCP